MVNILYMRIKELKRYDVEIWPRQCNNQFRFLPVGGAAAPSEPLNLCCWKRRSRRCLMLELMSKVTSVTVSCVNRAMRRPHLSSGCSPELNFRKNLDIAKDTLLLQNKLS